MQAIRSRLCNVTFMIGTELEVPNRMKTNSIRIKLSQVITAGLFILGSVAAQASLLKRHTKVDAQMTEKSVASADASINFAEWESEFNQSLKESKGTEPEKDLTCKGKNCKFKEMQALDSSFEF